jgi:hypothetical protein
MATLTISHYIYLSREERYKLHFGESIDVTGISIPVWFHRGTTSEPAKEMFCKYKLTNEAINKTIISMEEGYQINLPQNLELSGENVPKEVQDVVSVKLGTSGRLLDTKDGGSEWLEFRQYNKIKKDIHEFNVVHFVEIKPYELLQDTMN